MSGTVTTRAVGALRRVAPIATWMPGYERRWLLGDVLAGLVVATLAVPQALGYSGIAGVPVLIGLYSIPLALLAYAVFGSSPQLVVGPVSTVSVLSGSLVADMAQGDVARAVTLTSALAVGAGIGLVLGGIARLGWAAEFMSRPIVTGFVFGLVLLIILGEVPNLLGLPPESGDVLERIWSIVDHLGDAQPLTMAVGVCALAVLFIGARIAPRVPWGLLVLVGAILASSVWGLAERGVRVVGEVPDGLPPLGIPLIPLQEVPAVAAGGLALALVGLAEGLSAARVFAARDGYVINANQEFIGMGAANIAAGLSGGMGVAGSLSKTAASRRAGGHTQMTGIVVAVLVVLVLLVLADYLGPLPRAVLSAIVIQAVWGLMDVRALRRYRIVRRNDFVAAVAAMVGVLIVGPLYGLLIAVGLAVLGLVYRSSRITVDVMGKVPDEKSAWGSIENHPDRRTIEGILVLRLDAPLFWANAAEAQAAILAALDTSPSTRALILDLEATSQIDTTSIDVLMALLQRLRERDVELFLVHVFYQARQTLRRSGFTDQLGPDRMWHSISAGVKAARVVTDIETKPQPQWVLEDDDSVETERIAVDHQVVPEELDEAALRAPLGGYQDPEGTPGGWLGPRH